MRQSSALRAGSVALVLALAIATSACSSGAGENTDTDVPPASDPETVQTPAQGDGGEAAPEDVLEVLDDALAGPDADGDEGRVFGATEEIVIQAVEKTFSNRNAKADLTDGALRVTMDGSIEDITATSPCLALEALLADGEEAFIVYSDGEVVCADRYDTD